MNRLASGTQRVWHVVTAVLLACAAAGASACHMDLRAEAREQWKRTYTLESGGAFEIRNTNGRIQVDPGDGNTVEVVAERVVNAMDDAEAKTALGRLQIAETVTPSRITLVSSREGLPRLAMSWRIDYTVKVPRWAAVSLTSTNGELVVTGLEGPLDLRTTNGSIDGRALAGATTVETTNGEVTLDVARLHERGITCETTNGSVTIAVPRDARAHLAASVTNGDIEVTGLEVSSSDRSRRRLEGAIGGGGGPVIRAETTNGTISLRAR
jgi:hypothetical protein